MQTLNVDCIACLAQHISCLVLGAANNSACLGSPLSIA